MNNFIVFAQEVEKVVKPSPNALGLITGLLFAFLPLLIVFLIFYFWIKMIIHAAKKDIEAKTVWIVVLVMFGPLGAVAYYFAVKRSFVEKVIPHNLYTNTGIPSMPPIPPVQPTPTPVPPTPPTNNPVNNFTNK